MYINVYGVNDEKQWIYSLRISSTLVADRHADPLLYECDGIQQYATISSQLSNHQHFADCCKQCLHTYTFQELLGAHSTDCCHTQRTKFPEEPRCRFTNIQKQLPAPFIVCGDFESVSKPIGDVDITQGLAVGNDRGPAYQVLQEHALCSFVYF